MLSNQVLKTTLEGLKDITRTDMCLYNTEAKVLACTSDTLADYEQQVSTFLQSPAESQLIDNCQFFKVSNENNIEYVLLVYGNNDDIFMIGSIVSYHIKNLLVAYRERFDKDNFFKNLILDNLLLVDIYNRAKKLGISASVNRLVYIIETEEEHNTDVAEGIKEYLDNDSKDYTTVIDEKSVIVIKEIKDDYTHATLERIAKSIKKNLPKDEYGLTRISFGTVVPEIKDVSRSYKEARMALNVGKIFYKSNDITSYDKLGIGRLIYQLPLPLCKMYIKEIFEGHDMKEVDEETFDTITKFFSNNLNVSETSRQLFIHRNTLVYRLDKLQEATGLDLRKFDDAITFQIAVMVMKYMDYMEHIDY